MGVNIINQLTGCKLIQTIKTVEWLINNTEVRTFNKISFDGYQREVNKNHVKKLVNYLENSNFYLPTSIICASRELYNSDVKLYIVDGQHRVEAFKQLKIENEEKYEEIKLCQVSVIVLEQPSEELEVETFITINKTSRKVDTSLAYVLKNKINRTNTKVNGLTIAKKEFLAVELGILLNSKDDSIWSNKILLEGNPTSNSYESISLNSFVRSTRVLISYFDKYGIISVDWENEDELNNVLKNVEMLYTELWNSIKNHWPNLFSSQKIRRNVIQGTIGVSSINKYIVLQMIKGEDYSSDNFTEKIRHWINGINISEDEWFSGSQFSKFSSESGFNIVANILFDSYIK